MICPTANEIAEFLAGHLSEEDRNAIDVHVDHCSSCRTLLATLVRNRSGATSSTEIGDDPRFLVLHELGQGAQAEVFAAFDRVFGREIALKRLRRKRGTSTRADEARFFRSARVMGRLFHPNILSVFDLGHDTNGVPYYTMPLVRGTTIARAIAECQDLSQRLGLLGHFRDLCHAVAYAHSRGVIHRDLKPQNVMVGEFGETLLLDWGLAKAGHGIDDFGEENGDETADRLRTAAGTAVGTPAYMSPEQAGGRVEEIDERSDVFGLGSVFYELLTGKPPFADRHTRSGGRPLPVRTACAKVPAELAAVADKALAAEKRRRYQRVEELAAEVDAYMVGDRLRTYRYSAWELVKQLARRHKSVTVATMAVVGVTIVALVLISLSLNRAQQEQLLRSYHLTEAYAEKADRLLADHRPATARIYAAAAALNNPANPRAPHFDPDFAAAVPGSTLASARAASYLYRTRFGLQIELQRVVSLESEYPDCAAFTPDGRRFVAAGDGPLRVWSVDGGRSQLLSTERVTLNDCAVSPNGDELMVARDDGVQRWQLDTGRRLPVLDGHEGRVWGVDFARDGETMASGGNDGQVRIWSRSSNETVRVLQSEAPTVRGVRFSPDGQLLAAATNPILLWEFGTWRLRTAMADEREVIWVSFSPDGRRLAACGDDSVVRLWDITTGELANSLDGNRDIVRAVAFSPDGELLASAGVDGAICVWRVQVAELLQCVEGRRSFVTDIAFSPDGQRLLTTHSDRKARLWQFSPGETSTTLRGHRDLVFDLDISADGDRIVTAGDDGSVAIWTLPGGQQVETPHHHSGGVWAVALDPASERLASAGSDGTILVSKTRDHRVLQKLVGRGVAVTDLAFSPDGAILAAATEDGKVELWRLSESRRIRVIDGLQGTGAPVAFSPSGKLLATVQQNHTVGLWDAKTGVRVGHLSGHHELVSGLAFSVDGQWLLSASKDTTAMVWDLQSRKTLAILRGHEQWVNRVAVSRDRAFVATASDDRTVVVWSTASWRPLVVFPTEHQAIALGFTPDSRSLALGDHEVVRIYPLDFSAVSRDPSELLREAEAAVGLVLNGFELEATSDDTDRRNTGDRSP